MDNIKDLAKSLFVFAKYSNSLQNIICHDNIIHVNIPIKNLHMFPEDLVEDKDKDKLFNISGSIAKDFDIFDIRLLYHYGFVYDFDDEYWYLDLHNME
ncbi:MAG TPA: hypothetical protein VK982_14885 [Bacteroidales bacterium]|nr:hypothetical protein [Bacteroidales bacterium]